jgi:intracellular septation protein A
MSRRELAFAAMGSFLFACGLAVAVYNFTGGIWLDFAAFAIMYIGLIFIMEGLYERANR